MKNKKIILLTLMIVCLFAISSVNATDNQTEPIVSTEAINNEITTINEVESEHVTYNNISSNQELLAINEHDDEFSSDNNEDVLSTDSPSHTEYSLSVSDTTIDYNSGGSVTININPSYNSYYGYDFYFRVFDSNNKLKIDENLYSTTKSTIKTYQIGSEQLNPGVYTIKLINYADQWEMDAATLTITNGINTIKNEISFYGSTFSELKNTISNAVTGSIINLYNDISYEGYYSYPITISKALTIDGNNHVIDGNNYTKIFSISANGVILKNIILKNGCTSDNGGAIYCTGSNINIENCKFINNSAYNGGAVYLTGYSSKIINCDFTENSATDNGGALYTNSKVTVNNSNFKSNTAEYGGAIAIGNNYNVDIINCNFNNNIADNGSAIKLDSPYFTITNTNFNGAKTNYHKYLYSSYKYYPYFHIYADDINLGDKLNLTVDWTYDLQGNMTIDIFSERLNKTVYTKVNQLNGLSNNFTLLIPNLKSGEYIINVTYSGDNIFDKRSVIDRFTVLGKNSTITFDVQNITWGTPIVLNPQVTSGATGLIEIYVNDEYVDEFAVGSKYNLMNVGGPSSEITLVYLGDDNYRSCSSTKTAYVERLNTSITLPEKFVSGYSTVEIVFNEDATGEVYVEFASNSYRRTLTNGTIKFDTKNMVSAEVNKLYISYEGDGKYNPLIFSDYVDVEIQVPTLKLIIDNVEYGQDVSITPYIKGASGSYRIYVDDIYKSRCYNGGEYTIECPDLGKHEVRIEFGGDSYYASVENTTAFRVYLFYPIEVENTKIIYNTTKYLNATFYDEYGNYLSNKPVLFTVNGTDYYRNTNANGVAVLDVDLKIGEYPISVVNLLLNEKYDTELLVFTSIQSENLTQYYNSGYDFNATFLDNNATTLKNSYVLFEVNGTTYNTKTDNEGNAKLIVPLPVGTYEVISNNIATEEKTKNKLIIKSSITSQDMSRVFNSSIDYKAVFYDTDGNYLKNQTVTFDVGFRKYDVKTDMNGLAVLNVGLAKGEYNITSINPVTNQKSVNKLKILERIINNDDVIVFGNEETYYSILAIDNNAAACKAGETVSFTLNGKKYDIKTGADGYASLKITELPGVYTVTASYKGYTVENEVTILENIPSILTLTAANINYGQKELMNITVNPDYLNGNVSIFVVDGNGNELIFHQKAVPSITKELSDLNASPYNVTVVYTDFDNLEYNKIVKSFNVAKVTPEVIVTVDERAYGENTTITINVPKASGNVTIKVGDKTYAENIIKDGVIIKRISDLRPGKYTANVTYIGNNNFNKASKSVAFEVSRGSIDFYTSVDKFSYGQDIIVKAYSSFEGKVTLKIGSTTKTIDIVSGKETTVNFGKLNAGKYTLNSNISPTDKNRDSVNDTVSFEVGKANANINVKAENIEIGKTTNIIITLPNGLNGNVKITLDGKDYTQSSADSKAIFNIANLKLGKYTVKATFAGNANYNSASGSTSFEVQKIKNMNTIIPNTVSSIDYDFACDLPQDASGTITVSINGKDYSANVVNGKYNLKLPALGEGDYQYTLKYSGDSKYAAFTNTNNLKIAKTTIKSGDANIMAGSGYDYKSTFINNDGTPLANSEVSFIINGKVFKTFTDSKGVATLNVGLGNGVYKVTTVNLKNGQTSTNTLKIIGGTNGTVIKVAKVTTTYNSGKKITVTLKDIFDKAVVNTPVYINYNGKISVVVTNAQGQATFGVSKVVPKTYTATVSFDGDAKYTKSSATAKIVVKKATVKLTASKKTFKEKQKTKKYTVTLKNNKKKVMKKVKLTIKINGKTYKAKTNSKGKATFNISKLDKKGKFTAVVKYSGNKYYKSLSKKVKITLK